MYKYIFLDLDDTLFDFKKSEVKAFKAVADYVNFPFSEALFSEYANYNQQLWHQLELGTITKDQLIASRFPEFFKQKGLTELPEELDEYFRHHLSLAADLIDGAEELLMTLKNNNKLIYAASNGIYHTQTTRLEKTNLMPYFDQLFISEKIGYSKPNINFFKEAFKHIPNFEIEKAIMIGDSLTSDIKGANNIGMDTIWFTKVTKEIPNDLTINYQMHSLQDITSLLINK